MARYSIEKERYQLDQRRNRFKSKNRQGSIKSNLSQRIQVTIEDTDLFLVGLMIDKNDLKDRLRREAELEGITDIMFLIKVLKDEKK